jgi:hypothetical protein
MPPAVRVQLVNDLADIEYVFLPTFLCAILLMLDPTNMSFINVYLFVKKYIITICKAERKWYLIAGNREQSTLTTNNGSTQ